MKINKNRVVIIGGSGFIGSHLVNKLIAIGYKNLLVIDRKKPLIKTVKYILGNFQSTNLLKNNIKKNDIVVHFACTTIPATSELNKEKDIMDNIVGTVKLLQICAEKKITKFIFLSSGGTIYGDRYKKPIKENEQTNPINSHGVMKLAIEKYINVFSHLYGLKYLIIRGGNPYGWLITDKQRKQGIIDVFLLKAINHQLIEIWGSDKIVRDYIYIDDLINFIIKSIQQNINNEIINVGTGKGASIKEIIRLIQKITGHKLIIKYREKRKIDVVYNVLNISKAKKLFNWRPKIKLKDGINKIYKNMNYIS